MEVLWESSNLSNRANTISSCPHSGRTCPRVHRRSGPRLDGEATVCCPMEALCLDQRSPMRVKSCAYAHILTEERMRTGKPKLVKIREGEDVEAVMPSLGADDHVVMSDGSPHNCKRCPVCRKTVEVGSRNRAVCNGMCSSIATGRNAPGMPTGVGKQPPHNEQPRHEPPSAPILDAEELTEEQLQVRSNVAWDAPWNALSNDLCSAAMPRTWPRWRRRSGTCRRARRLRRERRSNGRPEERYNHSPKKNTNMTRSLLG